MKSIKIKDLEILEQERMQAELPGKNLAVTVSQLAIENKKKDTLIQQLVETISSQNIEIAKLKGGTPNV